MSDLNSEPEHNLAVSIEDVHFHIGNGGTTFGVAVVTENAYPTLTVESIHFGHLTHYSELFVRPQDLKRLGEALIEAAEKVWDNDCASTVSEGPVTREKSMWEAYGSERQSLSYEVQEDGSLKIHQER